MTGPQLTTARLLLRLPCAKDGAFLVRLMNEPDWIRFIGDRHVHTPEEAAAYVERRLLPPFRERGFGMYVVETRADGDAVGICGLVKREALADADLGFAFLSGARGRGYALEASRAVLDDARTRLGAARVLAITMPDNAASARVLARLGMTAAGELAQDGAAPLRLFEWRP